jgi:TonB family protein
MAVTSPSDEVVELPPGTTFYLAKDKETFGPHSPAEILSFLNEGIVSPGDLLWTEGMDEWVPIREIIAQAPAAEAETFAPVAPTPVAAEMDALPRWARSSGDGMPKRLSIGVATAIFLHGCLLVTMSLGAAVLFKLNTEKAPPSSPEPAPLEVTMVEEPAEPPPEAPPPPPDQPPPPPPPAIPDVPIPTDIPPPVPQPVSIPEPVITPPKLITTTTPLAPTEPRPPKVARRALPVEPAPAPPAVDAGPSDYLYAPPPSYPYAARQGHEEGTVVLLVSIDAQGLPLSVSVDRSSGFPILDAVAQKQVAHEFRFRVGNSRVLRVPISFQEK